MADVFDKEKRSDIMSHVRSKANKSTELKLIEIFKENRIRGWERNYKVKGHPDFVFLDKKLQFLSTDAFGTGTIVGIPVPQITQIIGKRNAKETWRTIKRLPPYLNVTVGL